MNGSNNTTTPSSLAPVGGHPPNNFNQMQNVPTDFTVNHASLAIASSSKTARAKNTTAPYLPPNVRGGKEKRFVDHSYIDFSLVQEDDIVYGRVMGSSIGSILVFKPDMVSWQDTKDYLDKVPDGGTMRASLGARQFTNVSCLHLFPKKLMDILKASEKSKQPDKECAWWNEHGRSFNIRKYGTENTIEILPGRPTQYKSFVRSLNMW